MQVHERAEIASFELRLKTTGLLEMRGDGVCATGDLSSSKRKPKSLHAIIYKIILPAHTCKLSWKYSSNMSISRARIKFSHLAMMKKIHGTGHGSWYTEESYSGALEVFSFSHQKLLIETQRLTHCALYFWKTGNHCFSFSIPSSYCHLLKGTWPNWNYIRNGPTSTAAFFAAAPVVNYEWISLPYGFKARVRLTAAFLGIYLAQMRTIEDHQEEIKFGHTGGVKYKVLMGPWAA